MGLWVALSGDSFPPWTLYEFGAETRHVQGFRLALHAPFDFSAWNPRNRPLRLPWAAAYRRLSRVPSTALALGGLDQTLALYRSRGLLAALGKTGAPVEGTEFKDEGKVSVSQSL